MDSAPIHCRPSRTVVSELLPSLTRVQDIPCVACAVVRVCPPFAAASLVSHLPGVRPHRGHSRLSSATSQRAADRAVPTGLFMSRAAQAEAPREFGIMTVADSLRMGVDSQRRCTPLRVISSESAPSASSHEAPPARVVRHATQAQSHVRGTPSLVPGPHPRRRGSSDKTPGYNTRGCCACGQSAAVS